MSKRIEDIVGVRVPYLASYLFVEYRSWLRTTIGIVVAVIAIFVVIVTIIAQLFTARQRDAGGIFPLSNGHDVPSRCLLSFFTDFQ